MAVMTADTDAVGDILFECAYHLKIYMNFSSFHSFHAPIISSTLEEVKGSMYEAVCRKWLLCISKIEYNAATATTFCSSAAIFENHYIET